MDEMAEGKGRYREFIEGVNKVKKMQGVNNRNRKAKKGIESIVVQRVNTNPLVKQRNLNHWILVISLISVITIH